MSFKCIPNNFEHIHLGRGCPLIVSDSWCQIFHHASPIPGSRIHSWPVLVDNGIGFLSVRTRGDSALPCMCNTHLVHPGTCVHVE